MFKKMFGPKKKEGQGNPVPVSELRKALMEYFPKEGEINQYLTIESSDKTHEGFAAVWEFFIRERDSDGIRQNYLLKHTALVDIRPDEKAVYLKSKHFARTKRVAGNQHGLGRLSIIYVINCPYKQGRFF